MPVQSGHLQDSGKGVSNGEGGFVKGPAERVGHRGRRGAGEGQAYGWEESREWRRLLADF